MIPSLSLRAFRGLSAVDLNNLARINLIIGGNNVGKTSILEALVLLYGNEHQLQELPGLFRWVECAQHLANNDFWPLLARDRAFADFLLFSEDAKVTAIKGQGDCSWTLLRAQNNAGCTESMPIVCLDGHGNAVVQTQSVTAPETLAIVPAACSSTNACTELYQQLMTQFPERARQLFDILQDALEPRAKTLRLIASKAIATDALLIDLGGKNAIPFSQMGQGFIRCFHLLCMVLLGRSRMILIDEIESGLYYRSFAPFLQGLLPILQALDVQLFATTHSLECMQAAAQAESDATPNSVCFIRLDRHSTDADRIQAITFAGKTLQSAIDFGEEMR
jgi:hypothetical protein